MAKTGDRSFVREFFGGSGCKAPCVTICTSVWSWGRGPCSGRGSGGPAGEPWGRGPRGRWGHWMRPGGGGRSHAGGDLGKVCGALGLPSYKVLPPPDLSGVTGQRALGVAVLPLGLRRLGRTVVGAIGLRWPGLPGPQLWARGAQGHPSPPRPPELTGR